MTGFGRGEAANAAATATWEIKSVNSRFLDIKWRLPSSLRSLEPGLEKLVREHAFRGRVEIHCDLQSASPDLLGVYLNTGLARAMIDELGELAESLGREFVPDFNQLMTMSFLWSETTEEPDSRLVEVAENGLRQALAAWNSAREAEGADMAADLSVRLGSLTGLLSRIEPLVPEARQERFRTLTRRVQTLVEAAGAELDNDRITQEIAILADKVDVSEELTRLGAHLGRLRELLNADAEAGKQLDFLLQETLREINTLGNKSQDTRISALVVEFKAELEKCREQVQNIE
jgi:uncharacterized protein (TIGR00255 family)